MRWGKFVLLFQAIITLVIGIVFVLQMVQIDKHRIEEYNHLKEIGSSGGIDIASLPQFQQLEDIKYRFNTAGYVLFIVAAIEMILIMRLLD